MGLLTIFFQNCFLVSACYVLVLAMLASAAITMKALISFDGRTMISDKAGVLHNHHPFICVNDLIRFIICDFLFSLNWD